MDQSFCFWGLIFGLQNSCILPKIPDEFCVLQRNVVATTQNNQPSLESRFVRFSSWHKLKVLIA